MAGGVALGPIEGEGKAHPKSTAWLSLGTKPPEVYLGLGV